MSTPACPGVPWIGLPALTMMANILHMLTFAGRFVPAPAHRNPTGGRPWCFMSWPPQEKKYCPVPTCPVDSERSAMEGPCPGSWTLLKGSLTHHEWVVEGNIGMLSDQTSEGCGRACEEDLQCCSFEWSPTSGGCFLNQQCEPLYTTSRDYLFCSKYET